MARVEHFYVHTLPGGGRAYGEAEVTWNPSEGGYDVEARTARDVRKGFVSFNEAGFAHRQWEARGLSDNLFPTLRSAVQAYLAESLSYTKARMAAIHYGVRPKDEPLVNPEFAEPVVVL